VRRHRSLRTHPRRREDPSHRHVGIRVRRHPAEGSDRIRRRLEGSGGHRIRRVESRPYFRDERAHHEQWVVAMGLTICVGASSGGHTNELMSLLEQSHCWPEQPSFCITTQQILKEKYEQIARTYIIGECNRRELWNVFRIMAFAFRCHRNERPDALITTGSLPLAIVALMFKLMGTRIIWIDSIAQVDKPSLSGRLVYLFADLFIVQWPNLLKRYRKAIYRGQLL